MEDKNYLVMEYIEVESLKSIVENGNSLPSLNNVLEWSIQICNVLNYLHSRKPAPFVFRVLCPENILLEETGMVKLIDFSTEKLYNPDLKSSGEGISYFSSPEESIGEIDKRSDIYSLGSTIYYLLTGKTPAGAFDRLVKNVPLNIEEFDKDTPQELIEIILKATEIDVNRRFQDILIMKEYLEVL
jgi:serine/threonine-protein kinase